jgi:hypothetical protein
MHSLIWRLFDWLVFSYIVGQRLFEAMGIRAITMLMVCQNSKNVQISINQSIVHLYKQPRVKKINLFDIT